MTDSYPIPMSPDIPVLNLVPNPSFEVTAAGWTGPTRDTAHPKFGSNSASTFVPSSTAGDICVSDPFPIIPNTFYSLSYWLYNGSGTVVHQYSLRWYDEAQALISETTPATITSGGSLDWSFASLPEKGGTSPSNAQFAAIHVSQQSAGFSNTASVDAFMVTEGAYMYDYFDGDTADDTYYTYDWLGTAHNSPSVRTPKP